MKATPKRGHAAACPIEIAPSILSADFTCLGDQVRDALLAGCKRIHVDVMDGQFVPNISMGALAVEALRPLADEHGALLEVHLMIVKPDRFLEEFRRAGADVIIVHVEACVHLHRTVQRIRELGARPVVALNPATSLDTVEEILPEVGQVLIMTVNPGFGGQEFIGACLDKIRRLRALVGQRGLGPIDIEVDGGVHTGTIAACVHAGATIAVAGSAVFNAHAGVAANVAALRAAAAAPPGAAKGAAG